MTTVDALIKLSEMEELCRLVLGAKDAMVLAQETMNAQAKMELALKKLRQTFTDEQANMTNVRLKMEQELEKDRVQAAAERARMQMESVSDQRKYADLLASAKAAYGDVVTRIREAEQAAVVKQSIMDTQLDQASARLVKIHKQIETDKQKVNAL